MFHILPMVMAINIVFFLILTSAFFIPIVEKYADIEFTPYINWPVTIPIVDQKIDFEFTIPSIIYLALLVVGLVFLVVHRGKIGGTDRPSASTPSRIVGFQKKHPHVVKHAPLLLGLLLSTVSFFYFSNNLEADTFVGDEYQVITAAVGYGVSGEFRTWDYCTERLSSGTYTRAFPHTWLIAQSFALFGVSEWSARVVSALFGAFAVLIVFLAGRHFTKQSHFALLLSLAVIWHTSLQNIFGIARMYAVLVPMFLAMYFIFHQTISSLSPGTLSFSRKKLSFLVLLSGFLLLVNYFIHLNSLVILVYALVFVCVLAIVLREKPIVLLCVLGFLASGGVVVLFASSDFLKPVAGHLAFFEQKNFEYFTDVLEVPFTTAIGIVFYIFAAFMAAFTKDKILKIKILSLLSINIPTAIFFVFCANRYYSFKYISFMVPISMLLIVLVLSILLRRLNNRFVRIVVFGVALASILLAEERPNKFITIRPKHDVAYDVLRDRVDLDRNEVIFGQFMRCYYFRNISSTHNYFTLLNRRQVSVDEFIRKASSVPSGWVIWNNGKGSHIQHKIRRLIRKCFKRHRFDRKNGRVNVFLYYFDQDRPCLRKIRKNPDYFSVVSQQANVASADNASPGNDDVKIDLSQPFSIAFWMKADIETPGTPISIGGHFKNKIILESRKDYGKGGFRLRYAASGECHVVSTGYVNDGQWHHIYLYQTGGQKGSEYGIYVDNGKVVSCSVPEDKSGETRFLVNEFIGTVQDIRIFRQPLSESQRGAVFNGGRPLLETDLLADGDNFSPAYHLLNTRSVKEENK